ncbi:MAG: hypothetical protein GY928_02270 [Colwellia sp.]|nr:hypothetical protein [Colwellia sp.]
MKTKNEVLEMIYQQKKVYETNIAEIEIAISKVCNIVGSEVILKDLGKVKSIYEDVTNDIELIISESE